ncbi:unnamed protein product, partial [Prorocentrum cordatum]
MSTASLVEALSEIVAMLLMGAAHVASPLQLILQTLMARPAWLRSSKLRPRSRPRSSAPRCSAQPRLRAWRGTHGLPPPLAPARPPAGQGSLPRLTERRPVLPLGRFLAVLRVLLVAMALAVQLWTPDSGPHRLHRPGVARQITDHAAQVDSRLAAQDTAIDEVRRDIAELRLALNVGEELSKRYVLRMGGASGLAAMRVRKFLALLQPERDRWERIHCPLPGGAGETTELRMSVDKSPKQVAREIACKKVRLALGPLVPDGKIFVHREGGVLTYKFMPICKVEPSAIRRQPPQVFWCDPSLAQLGPQRVALAEAVRGRAGGGGVLTIFPYSEERNYEATEAVRGRVLQTKVLIPSDGIFGPSGCLVHWNIHNFNFSNAQFERIRTMLAADIDDATRAPASCALVVAGDFNLYARDHFHHDWVSGGSLATQPQADGRRAPRRHERQWNAMFGRMVELVARSPTHVHRGLKTFSAIDRVFTACPTRLLKQTRQQAEVAEPPEELHARELSDHGVLLVRFGHRDGDGDPSGQTRMDGSCKPIPPSLFRMSGARELISAYAAAAALDSFAAHPPTMLDLHARILQEVGARMRDYNFAARLIHVHSWLSEFVEVRPGRMLLVDGAAFRAAHDRAQRADLLRQEARRGQLAPGRPPSPAQAGPATPAPLRQQLAGQRRAHERRTKLWSPFGKRRYLTGVEVEGQVVNTPSERAAALAAHWTPVFSNVTPVDERAAQRYLDRLSTRLAPEQLAG